MNNSLIIVLGILLLGALGYTCIYHLQHNVSIQADIDTRVKSELAAYEYDQIQVNTHGRDITINGEVISQSSKHQILQLVKNVYGVRSVNNQLSVSEVESTDDNTMPKFEKNEKPDTSPES